MASTPLVGRAQIRHARVMNSTPSTSTTNTPTTSTPVVAVSAAPSDVAERHFAGLLEFETDCWDVHESLAAPEPGFVLLDVRSSEAFGKGHVDGATSLPHAQISAEALSAWPTEATFVVYCNGPHCNGADKAALNLARLGRPVKKMIGGITGWLDEGFSLTS